MISDCATTLISSAARRQDQSLRLGSHAGCWWTSLSSSTATWAKPFREDKSFDSFPLNTVFTPDWAGNAEAMWEFLIDPKTYKTIFLPKEIIKSFMYTASLLRRMSGTRRKRRRYNEDFAETAEFQKTFSEGDFNRWTLNHVLAVHPIVHPFDCLGV